MKIKACSAIGFFRVNWCLREFGHDKSGPGPAGQRTIRGTKSCRRKKILGALSGRISNQTQLSSSVSFISS